MCRSRMGSQGEGPIEEAGEELGEILGSGASLSRGQEDRGSMGHEIVWALHPVSLNACSSGDSLLQPLSHLAVSSDLIHRES